MAQTQISSKVIEKILKETSDPNEIASRIQFYLKIPGDLAALNVEIKREEEKHKEKIRGIKLQISKIQDSCKHLDWSTQNDAYESTTSCNICGKTINRYDNQSPMYDG